MVGAVQDLVISVVHGKPLVFVLHSDGMLRVWDLSCHSRLFSNNMNSPTLAGKYYHFSPFFLLLLILTSLCCPSLSRPFSLPHYNRKTSTKNLYLEDIFHRFTFLYMDELLKNYCDIFFHLYIELAVLIPCSFKIDGIQFNRDVGLHHPIRVCNTSLDQLHIKM